MKNHGRRAYELFDRPTYSGWWWRVREGEEMQLWRIEIVADGYTATQPDEPGLTLRGTDARLASARWSPMSAP